MVRWEAIPELVELTWNDPLRQFEPDKSEFNNVVDSSYIEVTLLETNEIMKGLEDVDYSLKVKLSFVFVVGHLFTIGLMLGPLLHGWYVLLDRILPAATGVSVAKKVLMDQSIAAPICIVSFFLGENTLC